MRSCIAVLGVVVLFLAPCAYADVKAQELVMKPGTVTVTVTEHNGKVLPKAEIHLKNKEGEVVHKGTTDDEGKCTFKVTKPGTYTLVVPKRALVPFKISDKGELTTLLVALPAPVKYSAGSAKKIVKLPTLLTFIIGGVAVAAVGVAVFSGGGGGGHP